jgi:2-polyprenyl-3-methyl-5-hydroxy-6-metoxy-1,4-benzoquinol methylase
VGFGHEVDHDNSAYDVTISVECFEHDPHWRETFSNMVRMTRPRGLAAFRHTSRGRPARGTISVPIAADQAGRITRCVDRGLAASLQDATRTAIDALDGLLPR